MRVFAGSIARGSAHLTARPPRARRATRLRAPPSDAARGDDASRPSDPPPDSAARVAVTCRGREVSARVGAKLRSALLLGGVSPHNDAAEVINCRGLGTCGTCAVEIIPRDAVAPDEWTVAERARLNFPPHASPGNERLRLACQVRVRGPCEVRKYARFWGQGDALAPQEKSRHPAAAAAATTFGPFGRLEFALDPEAFAESSGGGKSDEGGE
jgi:ferredoxin